MDPLIGAFFLNPSPLGDFSDIFPLEGFLTLSNHPLGDFYKNL